VNQSLQKTLTSRIFRSCSAVRISTDFHESADERQRIDWPAHEGLGTNREKWTDILRSMDLDKKPSARIEAVQVLELGLTGTGNRVLVELFRFFSIIL